MNLCAPAVAGYFALADLDPSIPVHQVSEVGQAEFAQLVLASEQAGIPLPAGIPHDALPSKVLATQWATWMQDNGIEDIPISAYLEFSIEEHCLQVVITPHSQTPAYAIKPVAERLNDVVPGLGWKIIDVLDDSSEFTVYGPRFMANAFERVHGEGRTDEEFAEFHQQGDDDNPSIEETLQELKDNRALLPSNLVAAVGGHAHLLGWGKGPKPISTNAMKRAIKRLPANDQVLVKTILEIEALPKAQSFNSWCSTMPDGEYEHYHYGTAYWLVWDGAADIQQELSSDYEEQEMQGDGIDRLTYACLKTTESFDKYVELACDLKLLLNRWLLVGKALAHLPEYSASKESA